jgi:hypothetical protein
LDKYYARKWKRWPLNHITIIILINIFFKSYIHWRFCEPTFPANFENVVNWTNSNNYVFLSHELSSDRFFLFRPIVVRLNLFHSKFRWLNFCREFFLIFSIFPLWNCIYCIFILHFPQKLINNDSVLWRLWPKHSRSKNL